MDHQGYVIFIILVCVLAGLFALLHLIAAISQLKSGGKLSSLLMLTGSLGTAAAVIDCLLGGRFDWLLMLAGGGLVCFAAIRNGQAAGKLHWQHHLIRIGTALLLTLAFIYI